MSEPFTLRRFELAQPLVEQVEQKVAKAYAKLAAIILADEQTLKLVGKGNTEALSVYEDQAHDMHPEEVAVLLGSFIVLWNRFKLALNGLSLAEIDQLQSKAKKMKEQALGLESLEELPAQPADMSKP